jgi:predicted secreted protein
MSLFTSVAVYLTIWWTVLFAVLPLGVVSHAEAGIDKGDGGDPGAPVDPKLKRKFITTTWVSTVPLVQPAGLPDPPLSRGALPRPSGEGYLSGFIPSRTTPPACAFRDTSCPPCATRRRTPRSSRTG